ncbi:msr0341 [Mesorhizobium japonicum MAFF 303099]|uniref:Msr0341 protein n=1 Tax=Mesorhizobium japonicum (strain LMG 29417 / CECT 9101 / MAFF 303099) TaxID=266835 RepID=Q98N20_RHILO|nr:msr0341 [Mesorhizobium japonicum MAFF 303099]
MRVRLPFSAGDSPTHLQRRQHFGMGQARAAVAVAADHVRVGDQRIEHRLLGRLHDGCIEIVHAG